MKMRQFRRHQAVRRHSEMLAVVNASLDSQDKAYRRNRRKEQLVKMIGTTIFWLEVVMITLGTIIAMIFVLSF